MELKNTEADQTNSATYSPKANAGAVKNDVPLLPEKPHILVDAQKPGAGLYLGDFWTYRELLYFLTWRDIKVRYKQTLMGAAWVIVQPLFTMLLFTLFFNRFAGLKSGDVPYPLFAYSGLLLWTFFSNAVVNSTTSLIGNATLITKVYFPRVFIPAAAVGAGLVDLAIASIILIGLTLYYRVPLTRNLLMLPLFVAITIFLALAIGILVSGLTVKYRDLRHALPFIMQFWMFASPVIYPSTIVPAKWHWLFAINPLTGILDGFRASLLGQALDWAAIVFSAALTLCLLACSVYIFHRLQETFADVI